MSLQASSASSEESVEIGGMADVAFNWCPPLSVYAAQVAVLEEELATVASDDEVGQQAKSLLVFVKQYSDRLHRYLKFIGD